MNKVASYLQTHLSGEVLVSEKARDFFSTDASVLSVKPSFIVYPRSTSDVRKVARFAWQLAEKGHVLPITARGSGTDQTGAAIGKGIMLVFPAHLNRILELDTQQKLVRVQPGVNFKSLQETLYTHGLFLPPYPASYQYSTIGGAIANNSAGEKSVKYGSMLEWVDKLEVVLANGEVIQTGRISRKELQKKKGLATLEGELYRAVDGVLNDNPELIDTYFDTIKVTKNSIGYQLEQVQKRDGSFDLTPLFVGSQGTLGVVTEAILKLEPYNPHNDLIVAGFDTLETMSDILDQLRDLHPSALELVDRHLIDFAKKHSDYIFSEELVPPNNTPAAILFIEFDDKVKRARSKIVKRALKLLRTVTENIDYTTDPLEQEKLWAIRHSAATVTNYDEGGKASLPIIEDGVVPPENLQQFIESIYDLFERHHLDSAVWGHAGDANLHIQPLLDLSKVPDRQKVFKLMDEYYHLVLKMGGSIAAEHNDGRLRAPYVKMQVGEEVLALFQRIKDGCDPYNVLNPGVKLGTDLKDVVGMLRHEYSLAHLAEHLPRN